MRIVSIAVWLCVLVPAGCKSSEPQTAPSAASVTEVTVSPEQTGSPSPVVLKSRIDPCKLLTSDELQMVQGEGLQSASPSEREYSGFIVAQCYYQLPTLANSVVVNVTTAGQPGASPRDYWRRTFAQTEAAQKEGAGDGEPDKEARPEQISGIGDDAYWRVGGFTGALYVLKKNVIFRISVGGAADIKTKLDKSKTLTQKALSRI